jgi:prophage regulatory protein
MINEVEIMPDDNDRFLRLPEVRLLTGMSRSTIYTYIKNGKFPAQIKLGSKISVWSQKAISQWKNGVQSGVQK